MEQKTATRLPFTEEHERKQKIGEEREGCKLTNEYSKGLDTVLRWRSGDGKSDYVKH